MLPTFYQVAVLKFIDLYLSYRGAWVIQAIL